MKLENIVYDIKHILGAVRSDTHVHDYWLINKINQYRESLILAKHPLILSINPMWIQNLGVRKVRKVTSGDDPSIELSSVYFGKITLPAPISIISNGNLNHGYQRIASSSGQRKLFQVTEDHMYNMISAEHDSLKSFSYFFVKHLSLYIYPYVMEISPNMILQNPTEGIIRKTDYVRSGELIHGKVYVVTEKSVVYNGVTYREEQQFTADETISLNYSGNGLVIQKVPDSETSLQMEYPVDGGMAQDIVLLILTKEYQIELSSIQDVTEDNQSQLKLLKSYNLGNK